MFRWLPLLVLACLFAEIVSFGGLGGLGLGGLRGFGFGGSGGSDSGGSGGSGRDLGDLGRGGFFFGPKQPKNGRQEEEIDFFQFVTFRSLETADQVWDRFKGVEDPYLFEEPYTRTYFALVKADQIHTRNVLLPPDSLTNAKLLPFVTLLGLVDPEQSREQTGKVEFGDGLLIITQRTFPVNLRLNNDQFDALVERARQLYEEFGFKGSSTTASFFARNTIPAEFIYVTNAKFHEVIEFEKKLDGLLGDQGSSNLRFATVFKIRDPLPEC